MTNRRQFFRQTAAVLLAFGFIACLPPGFAAGQDLSTPPAPPPGNFAIPTFQEEPGAVERRNWVIQRYINRDLPGRNAKFGATILLGRLALNPKDAAAIERAGDYYSNLPANTNGEQFSYPGIAYVVGKHWDQFTPAQLDGLKARLKDFSDLLGHGTENHAIMKCVAAYLFAQYWPDDDGWIRGQYSSEQVSQATRARILNVVNGYFDKHHEEWISENYTGINLFPWHALYDCATDPEIKHAAYAALCYHYASLAANTYMGLHISPFPRGRLAPQRVPGPGTTFLTWLYAGPEYTEKVPATDGSNFGVGGDAGAICTYVAVSDFVMPPAILSLWRGETAPYELTSSAAGFGHHGTTTGFWGTGEPGATSRYIYRHPDYAIGSGFIEYYPDEFYDQHHSTVSILYRSAKEWAFVETHHPYWRSNTRAWGYGVNSPFIQTAQHKSAAIAILNIPETDPWAGRGRGEWQANRDQHYDRLIQEALVRYPKSIDEAIEENGWVFLREGSVYIAIRPLKAYTIDANYAPATADFNTIRSAFARTGFVYDVATEAEYASFEAFRAAAIQNPPTVDWDGLSVTYTSLAGDTITATWNPPNYSGPPQTKWVWMGRSSIDDLEARVGWRSERPGGGEEWSWDAVNKQWIGPPGDPWHPGSRVRVRPNITVNGIVVPVDTTYPPFKSPSANIADGVLSLQTPGGSLEIHAPRKK